MTRLSALLATASLLAVAACSSSGGDTSGTSGASGGVSGTTTGAHAASSGATGATVSGGSGTTTGGAGSASATTTAGTTTGAVPFKLTFAPTEADTPANASLPITVNIDRDPNNTGSPTFNDPLQFSLAENPDAGITALFSPNPAGANDTTMTLSVAAGVSAGDHLIHVVASDTVTTGVQTSTGFDVNVSAPALTLLVDNDASDNNDPTNSSPLQSASDALFTTLLGPAPQGVNLPYAYFVVPSDGSGSSTPTFSQLQNYDTVIWYTGNNYGGTQPTMTAAQEAVLTGWLDTGNKTLILFSQNLIYDLAGSDWNDAPADNLLANYLGAIGTDADGDLAHVTYTANGTSLFNNEIYNVVKDTPIGSSSDRINPGPGVDSLITVEYDETGSGTAQPVPTAVGHFHVGTAGTSTIAYVGLPIEDVQVDGASQSSNLQLFQLVLSYAVPVTP